MAYGEGGLDVRHSSELSRCMGPLAGALLFVGALAGSGCLSVEPGGKRFQCGAGASSDTGDCPTRSTEGSPASAGERVSCSGPDCEPACTSTCGSSPGNGQSGSSPGGSQGGAGGEGGGQGGGSGADGGAGGKPDGGSPLPSWERLLVPTASAFHAVAARAMNDVYVAASDGALHHFDGAAFTEVFRTLSPVALKGVWVTPGGAVFAVGDKLLLSCPGSCTRSDRFTSTAVVGPVAAVCGLGEDRIFAVGDDANGNGVLHRWNGTGWSAPLSTASKTNASCWVAPNQEVFIGARSKILRFTGAGFVDEPIDYGTLTDADITYHVWRSLFGKGDQLFACGYRMRVLGRKAGAWAFTFNRSAIVDCWAMAGPSADELFAAGEYSDFTKVPHFVSKKAEVWDYVPTEKSPPFTVYGMWASPNGSYFGVGEDEAQKVGAMFRRVMP